MTRHRATVAPADVLVFKQGEILDLELEAGRIARKIFVEGRLECEGTRRGKESRQHGDWRVVAGERQALQPPESGCAFERFPEDFLRARVGGNGGSGFALPAAFLKGEECVDPVVDSFGGTMSLDFERTALRQTVSLPAQFLARLGRHRTSKIAVRRLGVLQQRTFGGVGGADGPIRAITHLSKASYDRIVRRDLAQVEEERASRLRVEMVETCCPEPGLIALNDQRHSAEHVGVQPCGEVRDPAPMVSARSLHRHQTAKLTVIYEQGQRNVPVRIERFERRQEKPSFVEWVGRGCGYGQ